MTFCVEVFWMDGGNALFVVEDIELDDNAVLLTYAKQEGQEEADSTIIPLANVRTFSTRD